MFYVAVGHLVTLRNEVDEHTKEGQQDHEDDPDGLHAATDIATAEDIPEDLEQNHEPDEEHEEDEHRPEDIHERIASGKHRNTFHWGTRPGGRDCTRIRAAHFISELRQPQARLALGDSDVRARGCIRR